LTAFGGESAQRGGEARDFGGGGCAARKGNEFGASGGRGREKLALPSGLKSKRGVEKKNMGGEKGGGEVDVGDLWEFNTPNHLGGEKKSTKTETEKTDLLGKLPERGRKKGQNRKK